MHHSLKLLPRLNFTSKDRAPPRLFDPEEASRYGPVNQVTWFLDLRGWNVSWRFPLQEHSTEFPRHCGRQSHPRRTLPVSPDSDRADLWSLSGSADRWTLKAEISLSPGDHVIVIEGDMKNLEASVDSLGMASQRVNRPPLNTAHLADVNRPPKANPPVSPSKWPICCKIFAVGAQIRVLTGPHANEVGIVVAIDDKTKNLVVFAAGSNKQFTVPAGVCVASTAGLAGLADATKPAAQIQTWSQRARSNDYSSTIWSNLKLKWVGRRCRRGYSHSRQRKFSCRLRFPRPNPQHSPVAPSVSPPTTPTPPILIPRQPPVGFQFQAGRPGRRRKTVEPLQSVARLQVFGVC